MKDSKYNSSSRFRGKNSKSSNKYRSKRSGYQNRPQKRGSSLNPLMFVKKAVNVVETPYIPVNSFSDFPLNKSVKNNIRARGYDKPTAIQDQAMFSVLEGKDLVGIANTGTGKTAVFLLPLITKTSKDKRQKVLIVTPTRELAAQIQEEFKLFSFGTGVFSSLCIGGTSLNAQARQLRRQPNFVIGTPGRIKDLQARGILRLGDYRNVVLDEVDRMLE